MGIDSGSGRVMREQETGMKFTDLVKYLDYVLYRETMYGNKQWRLLRSYLGSEMGERDSRVSKNPTRTIIVTGQRKQSRNYEVDSINISSQF